MKLIINCTNLNVGGGLQVAVSFLNEIRKFDISGDEFHVLLSKEVDELIDSGAFGDNCFFYKFKESPAYLMTRSKVVRHMRSLENKIQPDVVFSIFGPSYWRPSSPHLMGVAVGWCYNFDSIAWKSLSLLAWIRMRVKVAYRNYYLRRDADNYVVETSQVKENFRRYVGVSEEDIDVVSNTVSAIYVDEGARDPDSSRDGVFRIFVLSANYIHKNISIIKSIIPILKCRLKRFEFVVTLTDQDYNGLFRSYTQYVKNVGVLKPDECISWYQRTDVLFLPTLLESFTATYIESMAMHRPVVTTDLNFAHALCGDAALYYSALSPEDAADKLFQVYKDEQLYDHLVSLGLQRLQLYPTAEERALSYLDLCRKCVVEDVLNRCAV